MLTKKILYYIEIDVFLIILLVACVGLIAGIWENFHPHKAQVTSLPSNIHETVSGKLPPEPTTTVGISPDGQMELQMQTIYYKDKTQSYVLTVRDVATNAKHHIFTFITEEGIIMKIPFNSWSPDNQYFFLSKKEKSVTHYFVFMASGESIDTTHQYLDVSDLFTQAYPAISLNEVTGWASPTLLILTTKNSDGNEGQSFWFDVNSHSFIPLSTQF